MQPRDLFGVALRVLGIWFLSEAGYRGVYLLLKLLDRFSNNVPTTADKLLVGFYLLLALVLLTGANGIVRLCYGPDSNS
jgi:hypothetical protein